MEHQLPAQREQVRVSPNAMPLSDIRWGCINPAPHFTVLQYLCRCAFDCRESFCFSERYCGRSRPDNGMLRSRDGSVRQSDRVVAQVNTACQQAMRCWWEDGHPGWMIFTLGNQHFERLDDIIAVRPVSALLSGLGSRMCLVGFTDEYTMCGSHWLFPYQPLSMFGPKAGMSPSSCVG